MKKNTLILGLVSSLSLVQAVTKFDQEHNVGVKLEASSPKPYDGDLVDGSGVGAEIRLYHSTMFSQS